MQRLTLPPGQARGVTPSLETGSTCPRPVPRAVAGSSWRLQPGRVGSVDSTGRTSTTESEARREPVEVGVDLLGRPVRQAPDQLGDAGGAPLDELVGRGPAGDQHVHVRGAGAAGGGPGLAELATLPAMFGSIGVVIQPSACAEIQPNVFGPPPAPMISGRCGCTGFGHAQDGPNETNSPVVGRLLLRPQRPHRLDVLAQHRAPPAGRDAVVGELVGVPAEAGAERDPAAGEVVERGDRLGQRDRVVTRPAAPPRWRAGSATVTAAAVASETHGSRVRR